VNNLKQTVPIFKKIKKKMIQVYNNDVFPLLSAPGTVLSKLDIKNTYTQEDFSFITSKPGTNHILSLSLHTALEPTSL
jgi:hypothetical protein